MNIGYACIPLGVKYKTTRKFILKNYSEDILYSCIKENLNDLLSILEYNLQNKIYMFRISSDIIPFASHEINTLNWQIQFKDLLLKIGNFAKENKIRLSMHPGQYTVLNTLDETVLKKSIADLKYHCDFLDSLGIDKTNKIIIHIGGVYGDKASAINRFIKVYNSLDKNIKDRLIIENDEKNYSIDDVLKISSICNIPVVFDNLHYLCMEGRTHSNTHFESIMSTWSNDDGKPKVHYSEQALNKRTGSHSDRIHISKFKDYLSLSNPYDFDIMLEVKDKDFSAFKGNNFLNNISSSILLEKEFNRYKFFLQEYSKDTYIKGKYLIFNEGLECFYNLLEGLEFKEKDTSSSIVSYKNFISEFLDLNLSEKNYLEKLFQQKDLSKIKAYLLKLSLRSDNKDILQNYFLFF